MRFALRRLALMTAIGLFTIQLFAALEHPAPQTQDHDELVIKRNVRRVIVDVVVTDSSRKPVHGLTQKVFSVTEDGKPQKILSFDVHDLDSSFVPPKLPPLPPNTFVNVPTAPERGPLYVLLLDLRNTFPDDQPFARQQLLKFLKDKPTGTRFAIFVLSDTLRLIQGFTEDKDELFAAADPRKPRSHVPMIFLYGNNYGRGDSLSMIAVLARIAQYLDGLPGRKNLIWFSGSFPMRMFPSDDDPPDLQDDIRKVIDTLVQAEVAVYLIDVRGVVIGNRNAPEETDGGLQFADSREWQYVTPSVNRAQPVVHLELAQYPGGSPMPTPPNFGSSISFGYMGEDDIAEATGGHAFYSTNDLKGALLDATEIGGNYYTLTYAPSNENYDGKLRKIHVGLSTKGYQLSYRRSYYADDPDSPPHGTNGKEVAAQQSAPRKIGDSLSANMQHGAPMAHQIYFRVHIHPIGVPALATPEQMTNLTDQPGYFRVRRKNRPAKPLPPVQLQTYAIDYILPTQAHSGKSHNERPPAVEIASAAYNDDGQMLNALVQKNDPADQADGTSNPNGIYRVEQQLDVPLTATSIRIAVRDVSTDRVGAMEVPLPLAPELSSVSNPPASPSKPPGSTKPQ